MVAIDRGLSFRQAEEKFGISISTLHRYFNKIKDAVDDSSVVSLYTVCKTISKASQKNQLLTSTEEDSIVKYILFESARGFPISIRIIKSHTREVLLKAKEKGEKRPEINMVNGPSSKFMRGFFSRHPEVSFRQAERVDRGRINQASRQTVEQYFETLKDIMARRGIMEENAEGGIVEHPDRLYKADEVGWGVEKQTSRVLAKRGSKRIHTRIQTDQSHKTLMLTVCGNGEVLSSLLILEKSFPLLTEEEAEQLPDDLLISRTTNGSMESHLFVEWLNKCVIPHKQKVNPNEYSLLLIDNHSTRFSLEAIDVCKENKIEMLCYPGHLTHILQGPDVVLNKPLKYQVSNHLETVPLFKETSEVSRLEFICVVTEAISTVCTTELVKKTFSSVGVSPFDPEKTNLDQFPQSLPVCPDTPETPLKLRCSECRKKNVEAHPLCSQTV